MSDALKKLKSDLSITTRMLEKMEEYLQLDNLFFSLGPNIPALTLGGYLMRQYRLNALSDALSLGEQEQLSRNQERFQAITSSQVVKTEQRLHREYKSRLRQWEEYLRELRRSVQQHAVYYRSSVDTRLMLAEIDRTLQTYPYRIDEDLPERLALMDAGLSGVWYIGKFQFFEEWEPAYPEREFWYLYGQPGRENEDDAEEQD